MKTPKPCGGAPEQLEEIKCVNVNKDLFHRFLVILFIPIKPSESNWRKYHTLLEDVSNVTSDITFFVNNFN